MSVRTMADYLPFEFNITEFIRIGKEATIVLLVNNELNHETIPQGITAEDYERRGKIKRRNISTSSI